MLRQRKPSNRPLYWALTLHFPLVPPRASHFPPPSSHLHTCLPTQPPSSVCLFFFSAHLTPYCAMYWLFTRDRQLTSCHCCCCQLVLLLLLPACVWGIARLIAAAVVCCCFCCCCFCNFSCSCSCLTLCRLMSKWIIMNSRVFSRRHKISRWGFLGPLTPSVEHQSVARIALALPRMLLLCQPLNTCCQLTLY